MKRKPNAKFMAPVQPDAVLGAIVGTKPIARTEITKLIWQYIKQHGRQGKVPGPGGNRRTIYADAVLRPLFNGKDSVTMFELPTCISVHLVKG